MNSRQRRTAARSHPLYREVKEALGRRPVPEDFKLIETVKRKLAGMDDPYAPTHWSLYGSGGNFGEPCPFFLATFPAMGLSPNFVIKNLDLSKDELYGWHPEGGRLPLSVTQPPPNPIVTVEQTNGQ